MTPEEIKSSGEKLQKLVDTVEEYKAKIEKIKKDSVDKINAAIDDLEKVINSGANSSVQFIETKTKKATKKIDDALIGLRKKLEKTVKNTTDWFEKQADKVKESTVKSSLAKLGMEINEVPEALLKMIPVPSISISVPAIPTAEDLIGGKLEEAANSKEYVKLPRLKL